MEVWFCLGTPLKKGSEHQREIEMLASDRLFEFRERVRWYVHFNPDLNELLLCVEELIVKVLLLER